MINIFANEAQHKIKNKIRLIKLGKRADKQFRFIKKNNANSDTNEKIYDYFKTIENEEIQKMELQYHNFIDTFVLHKQLSNISIENIIEHNIKKNEEYKVNNYDSTENNKINNTLIDNYRQLLFSKPNLLNNLINNINNENNENNENNGTVPQLVSFNLYEQFDLDFINNTKFDENILKQLLKKDGNILNYLFENKLTANASDLKLFFDKLKCDYIYNDNDETINYDKSEQINLNANIKKINIVYQYSYKNDKVTGLGDFIRGCYYFIQFCEKYGLDLEFHINNHPIKLFLVNHKNKLNQCRIVSENIEFINESNAIYYYENNKIAYHYLDVDNKIKKHLNKTVCYNNELFIYSINHPKEININEHHKEQIRYLLKPTNQLILEIEYIMNKIKLNKYNFIVLQIRVEDNYTIDNVIRIKYMLDTIKNIKNQNKYDIFLISNNNDIKSFIINKLPELNIKTFFKTIGHVADKSVDNEKIKNTLIEFYIMSVSKNIHSITCYEHGSGFSKWCSVTYNIPYVCYLLPPNK